MTGAPRRIAPLPVAVQARCRDLAAQALHHDELREFDFLFFAMRGLDDLAGFVDRRPSRRLAAQPRRRVWMPDGSDIPCLADSVRFDPQDLRAWAAHTPAEPTPEDIARCTIPAVRLPSGEVLPVVSYQEGHTLAAVRGGAVVCSSRDRHNLFRGAVYNHRLRYNAFEIHPIVRVPLGQ